MEATNNNYRVTFVRQNERQDIFRVYNRQTGETDYVEFSREMGLTCEDVLSAVDDNR